MPQSGMTSRAESLSDDEFRHKSYSAVYQHACRLTGSDHLASSLSDRVIKELEQRRHSIPDSADINAFLIGQLYLYVARNGLEEGNEKLTYVDPHGTSAVELTAASPLPQQTRTEPAGLQANDQPALLQVSEQLKSEATAAQPAPVKSVNDKKAIEKIDYDANSTLFWTPDHDADPHTKETPEDDEASGSSLYAEESNLEPRYSPVLSVINVLLGLGCALAIVFLLVELKVLELPF